MEDVLNTELSKVILLTSALQESCSQIKTKFTQKSIRKYLTTKKRRQSKYPQLLSRKINYVTSLSWNSIQQWKKMNSWYKQHRGISDALYQVKEAIQTKQNKTLWKSEMGSIWKNRGSGKGDIKHSLETSGLNLKGSQLQNLAGKKNQYAKSAENSGQTRPLSAPSTLSNPTAESSDPIRQRFQQLT